MAFSYSHSSSSLRDDIVGITEEYVEVSIDLVEVENITKIMVKQECTMDPLSMHCSSAESYNPLSPKQLKSELTLEPDKSLVHCGPAPSSYYPKKLKLEPTAEPDERLVASNADEVQAQEALRLRYPQQVKLHTSGLRRRIRNRIPRVRTDSDAVIDDVEWRKGERVIEICSDDGDIPLKLKELINKLEASHQGTITEQLEIPLNEDVRHDGNDSDDELDDMENSTVHEMFDGDKSALNFKWSPMSSFVGRKEVFQPDDLPGPRRKTTCCYDAFRHYWDDEILEHIVRETNRHAVELATPGSQYACDWYDTNVHEVLVLFAFWTMLGIIQMPTINSCFSNHSILKTNIFRTLFTKQRYWLLSRALYFADHTELSANPSKLLYLGPLVDHLNKKFSEAYIPSQDIKIVKSPILWRNMKHASGIKVKGTRVYVQTYELFEVATGYLWSFTYVIKDCPTSSSTLRESTKIVVPLLSPLLNKGHKLFMNNVYNAILLARFLKHNRTDCVCMLRKTQRYVPSLIKLAKIPEGTCIARHSGDMAVMAYQGRRTIYTVSTCHGANSLLVQAKPGKPSHYEPAVIVDYDKSMRVIEEIDQTLEPYMFFKRKKYQIWYIKIFKRLLNISILNSRVLVCKSTNDQVQQIAFRLELVEKIMKNHLDRVPKTRRRKTPSKVKELLDVRFEGSHFIIRNEVSKDESKTVGTSRNSKGRRYCRWCMMQEKRYRYTVWKCEQCDVSLCLEGCFKNYHTRH